jgi:hypothetical protein
MENPLLQTLASLFERDLKKLEEEIKQYEHEALLWKTEGGIKNPGGNLCLHLCGNLQYYIGTRLGNTGYERNRPLEFSAKNIDKTRLIEEIKRTKQAVLDTLEKMNDENLHEIYPEEVLGYPMTTVFFLIHLSGHLSYHLGQVNYHRRLIDFTKGR